MKRIYYVIQIGDTTFFPKDEHGNEGDVAIGKAMQFESRHAATAYLFNSYGLPSMLEVRKVYNQRQFRVGNSTSHIESNREFRVPTLI